MVLQVKITGIAQFRNDFALHYTFWNGSSWVTESVDTTVDAGSYNSLATEGSNKAHIAYTVLHGVWKLL